MDTMGAAATAAALAPGAAIATGWLRGRHAIAAGAARPAS